MNLGGQQKNKRASCSKSNCKPRRCFTTAAACTCASTPQSYTRLLKTSTSKAFASSASSDSRPVPFVSLDMYKCVQVQMMRDGAVVMFAVIVLAVGLDVRFVLRVAVLIVALALRLPTRVRPVALVLLLQHMTLRSASPVTTLQIIEGALRVRASMNWRVLEPLWTRSLGEQSFSSMRLRWSSVPRVTQVRARVYELPKEFVHINIKAMSTPLKIFI